MWVKLTTVAVVAVSLQVQAQVEKPVVMNEAMISVSIPDVHGFLDEVGLVASKVQPAMNGAMLKMVIGMQLGDMNLAGVPVNGGLSIVAMDPTNIFGVVEVSEAQSSAYLNMASAKQLQAAYVDGAVVVAKEASALEQGKARVGAVKNGLLASNASHLSVALQPSEMIARNREAIDGFMELMPTMLGMTMMQQPGASLESTQSITKVLQAELAVLLSISEQCREAEIKIVPDNGALVFSETFVPKAGTSLAALVNAPAEKQENPKLHAGILGEGAVKVDFLLASPAALAKFVADEAETVIETLKLEEVDADEIAELMTKWIDIYAGSGCEVVSFGEERFNVRYVMEVADEAKALETLRSMNEDMGPFLKLYEDLGMPMSMVFKENVRESDGVKIHEFGFKYDLTAMSSEQKEQFEEMGIDEMSFDLAVTDGKMFYAEKGAVEALIKKVKAGGDAPRITARSTYPKGGFYYLDWDMGEYMAFVAKSMPDDPSTAMVKQQLGTMFVGAPPITSAGFREEGLASWSITIPGELLAKYGQMIMMQQMQGMQQPAAAPAAVPAAE